MHKVRIVSLPTKGVSKQDGIVEVPEETDCSGITSEGKYPSDSTNPLQEGTKWECTKCELTVTKSMASWMSLKKLTALE
ncbi:hypothetical protein T06_14431 [Trichinella sp. T6]|nr:hypothetical protein T06_5368 [Trichinella sp. T6]KRX80781.1 hypothetical protein T06_14431 [Trichinella sp. T6]